MKKHLPNSLRALFLSLAMLLSLPMLAVEVEIGGINYDLDAEAKQAAVIKKSSGKYSGEVVIPESVEHEGNAYSVTSIGYNAFRECSGLTSVIIPNSVTSIGDAAFYWCDGLTSVTIPNSVTSIGYRAFYDCDGLTSVTIGNSVTSIGDNAFWYCDGLTSVHISDIAAWCNIDFDNLFSNPLCYADHLYLNGEEVKDLVIPNSVTSIGRYAFYDCSGLTLVTIPNSVTSIEYYAFSNCPELLDVYCYAENAPSTESNAFNGIDGENATLHVPAASLDSYKATAPWSSFKNIVAISTEVDGINYDFDADTKQATVIQKSSGEYSGEVVIPESVVYEGNEYSVTSIGESAFDGCSGLTSVTIPNSVTSIGEDAFYECSGLTSVHISDIAAWCNIDFAYYTSTPLSYAHHLYLNGEEVKDLVIPNSVTSIGGYAFRNCTGLTSVTIPNSVTSINNSAFRGCSGLTSVTIPNSVTSIGSHAFWDCSGLTSVTIGNSVTSIGSHAFWNCSGLTSVTIPNSVTSIGYNAFSDCSGLTSVTVPNSVTSIETSTFMRCSSLTSVTIPNSVTSIGAGAFSGCSSLTSVTIPNSVTSIVDGAFEGCSGLQDVYCYAENVPSTKSYAFDKSNYENATLHVPAGSIESYKNTEPWNSFGTIKALASFSGEVEIDGINYELNAETQQATVIAKSSGEYSGEVVIPESVVYEGNEYSVTSIGSNAFYGCSGLTSVTIPNSVTSIGEYAFNGCSGLTSVTIGNSVTSIGAYAFAWCSGLTSIVVEDENPVYDSRNNCNAIIETATNTLHFGCKTTVIPNSVTSIGEKAFACSGLTSVTIPNSVTSIGFAAFHLCRGLTSVSIGNSVTSIGDYAFSICDGLTSVSIGNSVTSIGEEAFSRCPSLTSVTIGNSVTSIGERAFAYCPELLDVYCYAENVPSTQSNAFNDSYPENATLHVPATSVDSYKASAPWSSFGKIVGLPNEYCLTVSSVRYATLYLDFNAEIPEGVEAYVAKEVVDSRLKMELVEGVLPANTGVIIIAEEGTYAFVESNETPAVIEKNLLKGTVEKTEITAETNTSYYVLSAPGGAVAMYLALLTNNKFWNNANKAYLPINYGDLGIFDDEVDSSVEQLSRRLVFDFDDETGIDELKGENGKVKTEIFDLSGRRVQKAQKGIFIRDGKLVVK